MTYEEFISAIETEGRYVSTTLTRYVCIEVAANHIEVFQYLNETTSGKAIWLSMVSRPLYRGNLKFVIPKSAFTKISELFTQVQELTRWYLEVMDTQAKVNLGIRANL